MPARRHGPSNELLLRNVEELAAKLAGSDARLIQASRAVIRREANRTSAGSGVPVEGLEQEATRDGSGDLEALCIRSRPSLPAQRARAWAFLAWDGGELAARAAEGIFLEDRLLWAIVADLAALK